MGWFGAILGHYPAYLGAFSSIVCHKLILKSQNLFPVTYLLTPSIVGMG